MEYVGLVYSDEKYIGVTFPQAPGCSTFGETYEEMLAMAQEALEGWLESWLVTGDVPPEPKPVSVRRGQRAIVVQVPAELAAAIAIRRARNAAGLTQARLAKLAGMTQPNIARMESGRANPSIANVAKVFHAMGSVMEISSRKRRETPHGPHAMAAGARAHARR